MYFAGKLVYLIVRASNQLAVNEIQLIPITNQGSTVTFETGGPTCPSEPSQTNYTHPNQNLGGPI